MNREDYERDLKKRQQEHLGRIAQSGWQPCAHDNCSQCVGTGVKQDGSPCVHMLCCSCPKCSPQCSVNVPSVWTEQIGDYQTVTTTSNSPPLTIGPLGNKWPQ